MRGITPAHKDSSLELKATREQKDNTECPTP